VTGKRFFICSICFYILTGIAGYAAAGETLNYRLKWLFNTSTVGDLYADEYGFFRKYGLDVKIKEGGPERDAIRELELGQAQFGVASADQVIRALSKGAPVKVLAQLFQINPLQWVYRVSGSPLKTADDLKGKTLGITYGGNDETVMKTLLAKAGLKEDAVRFFSVRYDYTPFYQGKVDLWPVYRNAQGPIIAAKLAAANEQVAFFEPGRFGIRFVANSVVTSAEMIEKHPKIVEDFTRALCEAWTEALKPSNREKSIKLLEKYDRDTAPEIREKQFDLTRDMVQPDPVVDVGLMDTEAWQQTEQIMLDQKLIDRPVSVETALVPPVQ